MSISSVSSSLSSLLTNYYNRTTSTTDTTEEASEDVTTENTAETEDEEDTEDNISAAATVSLSLDQAIVNTLGYGGSSSSGLSGLYQAVEMQVNSGALAAAVAKSYGLTSAADTDATSTESANTESSETDSSIDTTA